jgi:colicin import membrane protein
MATAATLPGFAFDHRSGLALSIFIHGLVLFGLSTSLILAPRVQLQQLAIEAVIVDESAIRRAADAVTRSKELDAQKQREKETRQAQLEREREALKQRKQQEVLAAEEQQRINKQRRTEEARQQTERERIEKQQAEAKQRSIDERKQREAQARADAEQQRMFAEAEREELERREAEMLGAMQEEEALLAASQSGEMSQYIALIQNTVERNWVRPASAQAGLECEVAVKQIPGGQVIDVQTVRCNGDDTVRKSIEDAVRRSSPLPVPANPLLFDRNLTFFFTPD